MNMISTGAFLNEMDASNKQPTVAEKFAAVWEKKNAKAARAGGVSLMALSLAACGSSSSTTTSTSTSTDTSTTTTTPVSSNFTTSIDALTGGDGADTFTGDSATVSGADSVTGGAGSDTLKVYGVAASALPTMSGIENLEIHNVEPGDVDLTGSAYADVTKLTLDGFVASGEAIAVEADDTLALKDVTGAGDVDVDAAATITSLSLEANGNVGISTDLIEIDVDATGVTSISLATTGKNYVDLDTAGATSAVTLTVTGDGTGTLDVDDDQTTIDASAATGGLKIQGDFAGDVTIKGTTGDDTIVAAAEISAKDVIDGGDGEDTLSVTADFSAKTGTISNIEIVELADTTDSQTIDADDAFAGVNKFVVSGNDTGAEGVFTINDVATGVEVTLKNVDPDATDVDDVTVDFKTDGTADAITFNVGTSTVATSFDALTADDPETVTLNLGSKDGHSINDLDFADATSVTVTGSGNATLAGINLKDADQTFDASAATGNLTLTFEDGAQDQTIKTGSGKDSVTMDGDNVDQDDSIDLGSGADTLVLNEIDSTITQTINAKGVETLTLTDDGSQLTGAITLDLRDMDALTAVKVIGKTTTNHFDGAFTFSRVKDGTAFTFDDLSDDTAADAYTINANNGSAAITVNVDAFGDSGNDTLTITNAAAVTLNQKSNADNDEAASNIGDLNTGDATALTVTAADNTLTLGDISSAKLTSLTVSGSKDITVSSGGSTTITTIDASGLDAANNNVEFTLGTGSALFARAEAATITGSDGNDNITWSVTTSQDDNVIAAGDNETATTTTTGEAGDTLVFVGNMTGDTTIDLSSTTDQVSHLSGNANAAAQTGFESINGASAVMVGTAKFNVTGSSGINHITTDTGNDVIDGGAGADVIAAKTGTDTVTTGAGADTIVLSAGTGYVTVSDFTVGDGGDILAFDSGIATTTGTGAAKVQTGTAASDFGADGVFIIKADSSNVGASMTAAQVEAAFISGFGNIGAEKAIALITADTDANSDVYIYQVTSDGSDVTAVDLLALLSGVEMDNFHSNNFEDYTIV